MKLFELFTGEFKYKGYTVDFAEDSDGFFWINYIPDLPKEIDHKYNKASNRVAAADVAKKGIDAAIEAGASPTNG